MTGLFRLFIRERSSSTDTGKSVSHKISVPNSPLFSQKPVRGIGFSSVVESAINEVIARQMDKKQQMQWRRKSAHYLLQTRTVVLNDKRQDKFSGTTVPHFLMLSFSVRIVSIPPF